MPSLTEPWWTWDPGSATTFDRIYRGFNLFEAVIWFLFAALVLARWRRTPHSWLEVLYAAAFAAFGVTDILEAWRQSARLFAIKGLILAMIIALRAIVLRRWYPTSRAY